MPKKTALPDSMLNRHSMLFGCREKSIFLLRPRGSASRRFAATPRHGFEPRPALVDSYLDCENASVRKKTERTHLRRK